MVLSGPQPLLGQNATVAFDGVSIEVDTGKYSISDANRFGQKISEGDLRYQDFNPFESAESISNFQQGAGVLRMEDVEHTINIAQPYKEAHGVNASDIPAILSPLLITETLPSSNGTPVWVGEFVPSASGGIYVANTRYLVCVAGTKVFTRDPSGSGAWLDTGLTLAAAPLKQAVGTFGGTLIFGYGAAATAQATTDLHTLGNVQNVTPANIYIYAVTTDQSASYVAGGASPLNVNQVLSSTSAASGYTGAVQCGTLDNAITSLAPGGGIATLYVGKISELGEIDNSGVYRQILPLDTRFTTNCNPMRWYMGSGGTDQRGPVSLVFVRERSLWQYTPSSVDGGQAQNISPWASPVVRPPTTKGLPTAVQGSARWLYFTVTNALGQSFVWRKDTWAGATGIPAAHNYLDLGTVTSQTLGISSVTSATGNPLLLAGAGNNIATVILPRDGETELTDPNCRFVSSGYIDLSDITLGFPDEIKVWYTSRVVADNIVPGGQSIDVQFGCDGSALQDLGTASSSPVSVLQFPSASSCRRISPRLYFSTNSSSQTPQLWAINFRGTIVTAPYRLVSFEGPITAGGVFFSGSEDLGNPELQIKQLWADKDSGLPYIFQDIWNDFYQARIVDLTISQTISKTDETPQFTCAMTVLLVSGPTLTGGGLFYDTPQAIYDLPTSIYS